MCVWVFNLDQNLFFSYGHQPNQYNDVNTVVHIFDEAIKPLIQDVLEQIGAN